MNSQMTDLAFAGKCDVFGANGSGEPGASATGAARPSWASNEPSASRPKPLPARARNSRREAKVGDGDANSFGMLMALLVISFGGRAVGPTAKRRVTPGK